MFASFFFWPEENRHRRCFALRVSIRLADLFGFAHFSSFHAKHSLLYASSDDLLLLQLSNGVLRLLQTLAGCVALLPHHRQFALDHIVLLGFLRPGHLALKRHTRTAFEMWNVKMTKSTKKKTKSHINIGKGVHNNIMLTGKWHLFKT